MRAAAGRRRFCRHAAQAARGSARPGRQDGAGRSGHARRRARVRAGNVELPLSRLTADPGMGGRARAHSVFVALSGNDSGSLRALPPEADPVGPGASRLPQPPRLLGLGDRAVRALRPAGRLGHRRAPPEHLVMNVCSGRSDGRHGPGSRPGSGDRVTRPVADYRQYHYQLRRGQSPRALQWGYRSQIARHRNLRQPAQHRTDHFAGAGHKCPI